MGDKLLYAVLFCWVKLHALLPMWVLYGLSDILYLLIYRLAKYRTKVVRGNMERAFPEMPLQERRQLERRFYHHFTDYIVETIKLAGISQKQLLRRARLLNPEMIDPLLAAGHSTILLVMGHYGNWEWFTGYPACFNNQVEVHQIYRPLKNRVFDRLFIYLRTRFQARCIPKKEVLRDLLHLKQAATPALMVFIADQTPSQANLHYWTTFLNQPSAILVGPERLAVKFGLPVIYVDVIKERRGHYVTEFQLITDNPKSMPEHEITETYIRRMEQTILRDPAYWLWTHKRWKHQPETGETTQIKTTEESKEEP